MDECDVSMKWERRILISVVSTFIGFAYISFWILAIIPFKWLTTVTGLTNITLFHYSTFMVLLSYYRTIVTKPGYVPKDWVCLLIKTKLTTIYFLFIYYRRHRTYQKMKLIN